MTAPEQTGVQDNPKRLIRRLNIAGVATVVVLLGGIGGWATTTELSGAVIAPGNIVVESYVKKIQHPYGGVVSAILVREGDAVEEGQVLMRLDDTIPRSTLGVVRSQLDEFLAREARLVAERDGVETIVFPASLVQRKQETQVATSTAGEEKLFDARRQTRNGQRAQLRERIVQINEEIRGLTAQYQAKESEIKLIAQELTGVEDLFKKNLVSIVRYMQLQRDQARIKGEYGQFIADIARARGKISETELQIIQLDQDFRAEVLKDLREAQGKIAELRERVTAAEDQLRRVDIKAPLNGNVHQLTVHTIGAVIANGELIMQIVPRTSELVIEAKVAPHDIDQIAIGAKTVIRIMAGNQRTTPAVNGVLTYVAADLTREQQNNQTYYLVRASLPEEEVSRLSGLKLVPGMPAEAFIQTSDRTPLQYLLKPLRDQIHRTFRER